jgi:hypothetical protein
MKLNRINLRSRRGADGPLGFFIALPIWWTTLGIVLVLGYWFWSLASNMIGLTRSTQAISVGLDGESQRRAYVATALGGFASDYASASYADLGRATAGSVNVTVDVHAFPSPDVVVVQAQSIARRERFYPRPPNGGWE